MTQIERGADEPAVMFPGRVELARSAVENVRTANNNCWLILSNGLEVPVSRARRETLRSKGWFR